MKPNGLETDYSAFFMRWNALALLNKIDSIRGYYPFRGRGINSYAILLKRLSFFWLKLHFKITNLQLILYYLDLLRSPLEGCGDNVAKVFILIS